MRFRLLLEATASEAAINAFLGCTEHNTPQAKEDLIDAGRELIADIVGTSNGLFAYVNSGGDNGIKLCVALQKMINRVGADRSKALITLLSKVQIRKISDPDCFTNFIALGDAYQKAQIDLSEDFLTNPSLYSRGVLDFTYALQVLKIASNPNELVKRYGNSENIKYDDLFVNGEIKPSGALEKNPSDSSTIYGTVELWKVASGKGEKPASKGDDYPTFSNFKDAQDKGATTIRINGIFKYNDKAKGDFKWEPVSN